MKRIIHLEDSNYDLIDDMHQPETRLQVQFEASAEMNNYKIDIDKE